MKCILNRNVFLKILQRVQGIVEKRSTMPILSNVLFEAKNGKIEVMVTDLEVFIRDSCDASIEEEGGITINARKLFEIIKESPRNEIVISSKGTGGVSITSGRAKFNIMGLPAGEFPAFPTLEDGTTVDIKPETILEMIRKTYFAASTDETRYNINGILLECNAGKMKMVATDGHRLALIEKTIEGTQDIQNNVILPKKGVVEFKRLLEEKDGGVKLSFSKTYLIMKRGNATIVTRLIDGEFPDYNQVIPQGEGNRAIADRDSLMGSLKRVAILSTERTKGVKFSLSKGRLGLSSSAPDFGEASEEVDIDYDGEDREMGFNARYFVDALEVIDTDSVLFELKGDKSPGILRPMFTNQSKEESQESGKYTYIIMPMRV